MTSSDGWISSEYRVQSEEQLMESGASAPLTLPKEARPLTGQVRPLPQGAREPLGTFCGTLFLSVLSPNYEKESTMGVFVSEMGKLLNGVLPMRQAYYF